MEMYGQERAPGVERPERPTERPPTPPVASGAVPRDMPAWESAPREPMLTSEDDAPPEDLADVVLANIKREVNEVSASFEYLEALARYAVERDAENNRAIEALKLRGVQIGPEVFIMARLSALATMLLGEVNGEQRTAARLQYEQRCNTEIANVLEQVESQVARAKLTVNIEMPPNGRGLPRG